MDIYRYMSFFELYKLVKHKQLKFSKLSLMDDVNEGLAMSINQNNFDSDKHEDIKNSHYISCWTEEKDSIAMWLLYSKNNDAIRVKTTKDKLKLFADKYCKSMYKDDIEGLPTSTIFSLFENSVTDKVEYASYEDMKNKIKNNDTNRYYPFSLNNPLIKDKAYQFENEIRSSIRLKMRNEIPKATVTSKLVERIFGKSYLGSDLKKNSFDDVLHIDVDNNFIDEICFDQRMPAFQVDSYKEILGFEKNKIVTTNIFSSRHESNED